MNRFFVLFTFFVFFNIFGQSSVIVGGLVLNEKEQGLPGVNIYLKTDIHKGVSTDDTGYFEMSLAQGKYTLIVSYLGYQKQEISVDLQKNKYLLIKMQPDENNLSELVITVKETPKKELQKIIGLTKLKMTDIKNVPMLFGELDVLKAVQVLPGVKSVGEGSAGFSVNGGSKDQNLILLDGAPVYHPSHILGFFSVFTPDIINNLKLYKSSIPARFGNRLSSILEVNTRTGDKQSFHYGGGVGIIASQLYAEGPLKKDKSAFIISARKSYGDMWLPLLNIDAVKDVKAGFYDINLKMNFDVSENSSLSVSAYNGRDNYHPDANFLMDYGNTVGGVYFKHRFNQKLRAKTSLIYSKYNYQINIKDNVDHDDYDFDIGLSIESPNFKQDFNYFLNSKHQFNFGIDAYLHSVKPGKIKNARQETQMIKYPDRMASELDFYVQHRIKFNEKWRLTYGIRQSNFSQLGSGTFHKYNELGEIIDTITAGKFKAAKTYGKWAPHLAINWKPATKSAVKLSYDRTYQFLHYLINDAATTTPTDLWLPSSVNLKPQQSDAYSLEYNQIIGDKYFFSVGSYYRDMQNITDYKIGTTLSLADNIESDLLQQKGKAYGIEFLIKKTKGKLTGSLAYTYSKSEKIHPEINEGKWYPAVVDRPHDINLLLDYKINKRLEVSTMWQYYTGRPITYPAGTYLMGDHVILFFSHRNANRLPDYHRMDLSVTWYNKNFNADTDKRHWQSYWNFSIYNVYAHDNAFMMKFKYDENTEKISAYQVTLFKIVPAISYHFKF